MTGAATKRFSRFIIILSLLYLLGGVALYFIQDLLLFHPVALAKDRPYAIQQSFSEYNIPQNDGTNLALVKFTTTQKRGIVLYFHGNRQNIERYAPFSTLFTKHGYEVWMMDYRSFGKSTGKLSETVMYADALQVYQLATREMPADNIMIYGKSLGSGIAAQLASVQKCKQLILETPYYNIPQIAKDKFPIYPVQWLIKYNIPTNVFLPRITVPVTAFHGTQDEVIAYSQSKKLKAENPAMKLITVNGGKHNNLLSYPAVRIKLQQLLN